MNTPLLLKLAYGQATYSPDPSTQNGAILVKNNEIIAMGCNTFPYGVEIADERLNHRPTKMQYIEHAERNAIYHAASLGSCTANSVMYAPWVACIECARAIIQAKIKKVVAHKEMCVRTPEDWREEIDTALLMLIEARIEIDYYSGFLGAPKVLFRGEYWEP